MTKPYIPDFKKKYPEASEEVVSVLKKSARKMQYQEYDIKAERIVVDDESLIVAFIPGREDSLERRMEADEQFQDEAPSVEEQVILHLEIKALHKAVQLLSHDERYLITQIYLEERTERDLAKELGVSQSRVNQMKKRILGKLRDLIENNLCNF